MAHRRGESSTRSQPDTLGSDEEGEEVSSECDIGVADEDPLGAPLSFDDDGFGPSMRDRSPLVMLFVGLCFFDAEFCALHPAGRPRSTTADS